MSIHVIAEFLGVAAQKISRVEPLREILDRVIIKSGLKPINSAFHQFEPHGVSAFYLLRESHLSIHTWPEHEYAAIDIFCCGSEKRAIKALDLLIKWLKPKKVKKRLLRRDPNEKG
ncbi:MAG: adenosylmethionine decarboxylase [Candidatus Hadarchaeum sp.]